MRDLRPILAEMEEESPNIRKVDEALIERYVRYRSTLSRKDRERAEQLLKRSEPARRIAAFYREHYREKDRLDDAERELDGHSVSRHN